MQWLINLLTLRRRWEGLQFSIAYTRLQILHEFESILNWTVKTIGCVESRIENEVDKLHR